GAGGRRGRGGEPRRMAADAMHAQAGQDLALALDDLDATGVVERDEIGERADVLRLAERVVASEGAGPERHLVLLDPELRGRKQAMARPVVVVQVRDERDGNV